MHGDSQNTAPTGQPRARPQEPQPYYASHDFEGPGELTTTLVHALADVADVDVTQAEFRLSDHVDPDALNRLFDPVGTDLPQVNGHVSFSVWCHQVSVYHDGEIVISPPPAERPHH